MVVVLLLLLVAAALLLLLLLMVVLAFAVPPVVVVVLVLVLLGDEERLLVDESFWSVAVVVFGDEGMMKKKSWLFVLICYVFQLETLSSESHQFGNIILQRVADTVAYDAFFRSRISKNREEQKARLRNTYIIIIMF